MPRHLWAYSSLLILLLACQKEPEVVEPVRNDPSPQGYTVSQVGESFPEVSETANCYVLKPGDGIQFPLVKGGSAFSVGTARSAAVLWESAGSSSAPLRSSVVSGLALNGNKLQLRAGSQEGNAVVAVYDAEGQLLWSWHIWVTSALPEDNAQVYAHGAGTVMDRNLGATSAVPGDVRALGLMYQWGRKDPFPGASSTARLTTARAASTIGWPSDPSKTAYRSCASTPATSAARRA